MEDILRAVNLKKAYGKIEVLKNACIDIKNGSFTTLIGESGGGKTTLCKMIMGIEKPDSGSIFFNSEKLGLIRKRSFDQCAAVQYIFQDPYSSLEEDSTVLSTLNEPVRICSRNKRQTRPICEALNLSGLDESFLNKRISTLSGGERQRVCISRALIVRPEIIIADECTSMLDEEAAVEIAGIFKNLNCKFGLAFIILTHDIRMLCSLGGIIYVLHDGETSGYENITSLIKSPKDSYAEHYIKSMIDMEGMIDFEQNSIY